MTEEYLTIAEMAERLKLTPKTIQNKMAAGTFRKGIHYFSHSGMRPRFKWSACSSKLNLTGVNGNVIMSGWEDDNPDNAR